MVCPPAMFPRSGFVKICGVCNVEDARLCATLGANAIGMLLAQPGREPEAASDRLTPADAAALVASLPAGLKSVLLVHAVDVDGILELADDIKPSAIQVQKPVEPQALRRVQARFPEMGIIKTFSVKPGVSASALADDIRAYVEEGVVDAVLLDSARGGSGQVHDWTLSAALVAQFSGTRVILAGGLTAENVAEARRMVRPYGVDVMSGVTCPDRRDRKDPDRLRAFLNAWHESSAQ